MDRPVVQPVELHPLAFAGFVVGLGKRDGHLAQQAALGDPGKWFARISVIDALDMGAVNKTAVQPVPARVLGRAGRGDHFLNQAQDGVPRELALGRAVEIRPFKYLDGPFRHPPGHLSKVKRLRGPGSNRQCSERSPAEFEKVAARN
jgi:hypothetical protein